MQQLPCPAAGRVPAQGFELAVQSGQTFPVIVDFRLRQIRFQRAQFGITVQHNFNGRARVGGCFLGDVGNHPPPRVTAITTIGMQFIQDKGKQARLAAPVGARHPDLLSGMDLEAGMFEQQPRSTPQGKIFKLQHGRNCNASH